MQRIAASAFGPGFASAGSPVAVDLTDYGLRLVTPEAFDGEPPWAQVAAEKRGFNDAQLMLSWPGKGGARYALMVSDAAAIQAVRAKLATARPGTKIDAVKADGRTRAWSHAMVWVGFVVPLLLIVALVLYSKQIAGWAAGQMPIATERQLGEKLWALQKPGLGIVQRPLVNKMLDEIGAKLTQGSAYKYEFHLVDNKTINAFAMPGGFVVVHSGLIERASSAEEVAGVLAHEVQHVEKRHSLKAMAHSLGLGIAISLLFGDVSGGAVVGAAQEVSRLSFSRESETEADLEGMKMLARAGIDPAGLKTFFRKMSDDNKLALPAILSSHPASEDRFALIDKELPRAVAGKTFMPLPYKWDEIKAALK
jgi:beta-barrel assembly-enhancing protease